MLRRLSYLFAAYVGPLLVRAFFLTIRITENESSRLIRVLGENRDVVLAFWHAHQLSMVVFYRHCNGHILVSRSKDGEYAALLAKAFGHQPERGSSSRGGARGARALIEAARPGHPIALTPDGPRGPRHCVQKGALFIARQTNRPIVPLAIGFSRYWELNSWDRFRIPKPVARGVALAGEPIQPPEDDEEETLARVGDLLQQRLIELEAEADRRAAEWAQGKKL